MNRLNIYKTTNNILKLNNSYSNNNNVVLLRYYSNFKIFEPNNGELEKYHSAIKSFNKRHNYNYSSNNSNKNDNNCNSNSNNNSTHKKKNNNNNNKINSNDISNNYIMSVDNHNHSIYNTSNNNKGNNNNNNDKNKYYYKNITNKIFRKEKSTLNNNDFSEEQSSIIIELRKILAKENGEFKSCIKLFEMLPYKKETNEEFFVLFKKIVYKGIQQNLIRDLFMFVRDNIHYFPIFINSDLFIKLLEAFYDFEVNKKDCLLLEYYNHPFSNIIDDIFQVYVIDSPTLEKILTFLIGANDLIRFDIVFQMYRERCDVIKYISKELSFQNSLDNSNNIDSIDNNNNEIDNNNNPKSINNDNDNDNDNDNNNNNNNNDNDNDIIINNDSTLNINKIYQEKIKLNRIEPLDLSKLDLKLLSPILILRLVHRAILNNEVSNTIQLLDVLSKRKQLAIESFQIVLEVCHYKEFKESELIILNHLSKLEETRWYSFLLFFNQINCNPEIFSKLLNFIDNPSNVSILRRNEIVSSLIPIYLVYKKFDLAFFWLQILITKYDMNIESVLYYFIYNEVSKYSGNSFFLSIWTSRLEDYCGTNIPTQEKLDQEFTKINENYNFIKSYRGFEAFLQGNIYKTNDRLFKSVNKQSYQEIIDNQTKDNVMDDNIFSKKLNQISNMVSQTTRLLKDADETKTKTITTTLQSPTNILPYDLVKSIISEDYLLYEISDKAQKTEIVDHLFKNYFEMGYMPPGRLLLKAIYALRKDYAIYKRFSLGLPSNIYPILFDGYFFFLFLKDDFNAAIQYFKKQAHTIRVSANNRIRIISVLLENSMYELATKMTLTMIRNNISIAPLSKSIVHKGSLDGYNIPDEIIEAITRETKDLRIDSFIILKLISKNQIKEAYDYFIKNEEGMHHVDSIKVVLKYVFPQLFPLSDTNNIQIWKSLLDDSGSKLYNVNIQFYNSFFAELQRHNRSDIVLEHVKKDKEILNVINQKNLALILGSIKNNPQLVIDLFKQSRRYDHYHADIVKILEQNNSQINNGDGDSNLNQFLEKISIYSQSSNKQKSSFYLSDETIQFLETHLIDKSIVLTEPLLINNINGE